MTGRRGGGRGRGASLRNQGVGVAVEVRLGVLCGALCSSGHLFLFLELLLLQAALLLAKLGPAILEPDLADRWMDRSVLESRTKTKWTTLKHSI